MSPPPYKAPHDEATIEIASRISLQPETIEIASRISLHPEFAHP